MARPSRPGPFASLTGLLAPPHCGTCGDPCDSQRPLCARCDRELERTTPLVAARPPAGVDLVISAGAHEGVVRSLVTSLKFGRRLPLAGRAATSIHDAAEPMRVLCGAIVPVPPDPLRLRVRGFDPAEEIAIALSQISDLPLERCLERRAARRQVGRPRDRRLSEPPRVSAWRTPPSCAVLIDDVWTTGATLGACGAALRLSGSERVVALTLAHALRSGSHRHDRLEMRPERA